MRMLQFILTGSGSGVGGKKDKTKVMMRKISARTLMSSPQLPKRNLEGSIGLCVTLRQIMHPIEQM